MATHPPNVRARVCVCVCNRFECFARQFNFFFVRMGLRIYRRFISLKASALASFSRSTAARPGLTAAPSVGSTTLPVRLLYLAAFAAVSKIVVTAVPGCGVRMILSRCKSWTPLKAPPSSCAAANWQYLTPSAKIWLQVASSHEIRATKES